MFVNVEWTDKKYKNCVSYRDTVIIEKCTITDLQICTIIHELNWMISNTKQHRIL